MKIIKVLKFPFSYELRTKVYVKLSCKNNFYNFIFKNKLSKRGIFIPKNLKCKNLFFPHPFNIIIGKKAKIGDNVRIYHNVTIGQKNGFYPTIGNNVIIYPNSVIIGDVIIGDNSIIGAGSIVLSSFENNSIVAGNPAKKIN